jgi:hypothetical protein
MKVLTALWVILDSLPQMLWWILGGAVLSIWSLATIVRLARQAPASKKMRQVAQVQTGRLTEIQSIFNRTESSWYYWDETSSLLRSLAIGLDALSRDISDEAASKRLMRADGKEESSLPVLLAGQRGAGREGSADRPVMNPSRNPTALDDIEKALVFLETHNDFIRPERQT